MTAAPVRQTEAEIQHGILLALGARPNLRVWRANTGVAKDPLSGRLVRFGTPGQADVLGVLAPGGRLLAIECKSTTGRLTDDQAAWGRMVQAMGGVYVVARSVQDAVRAVDAAAFQPSDPSPSSNHA